MIEEFQQARRRWLVKRNVSAVEPQMDTDTKTHQAIAWSVARERLSAERVTTS